MTKPERKFQDRLIRILTKKGYLVINAASKQIFDIIAVKNQKAYPIEVKAKKTAYGKEQFNRQLKLATDANSCFFVIRQSKKRGKMTVICHGKPSLTWANHCMNLVNALEEYLDE